MQRGEAAHREADDMSLNDRVSVEHRADIVARPVLRISLAILGHAGRRIAAGIECDTAIAPGKVAKLRLPAAMVACKFVHEYDRSAGPRLFEIKLNPVIGG